VLDGGDLDALLANAEGPARGFQQCTRNLPPVDESTAESAKKYYRALGDCATKIDPALGILLGFIQ
jgi:hypothetical protein